MMLEREMYGSVRQFLEELGFDVQAEVKDCDVVARKDSELVIVEMKKNLTVRLLTQAVQRQRLGAAVYAAVLKPSRYRNDKKHKELLELFRRLGLGLLYVTPELNLTEVALHPVPPEGGGAPSVKKRNALERELEQRQFSLNQGGISKTPILTAYREQCLFVCLALSLEETAGAALLSERTGLEQKQISAMLNRNYYRWFERVERGVYRLTEEGRKGLLQYPTVTAFYSERLQTIAETEEI